LRRDGHHNPILRYWSCAEKDLVEIGIRFRSLRLVETDVRRTMAVVTFIKPNFGPLMP
jgi:hypothetical protein